MKLCERLLAKAVGEGNARLAPLRMSELCNHLQEKAPRASVCPLTRVLFRDPVIVVETCQT